jgi:hypothetical protein
MAEKRVDLRCFYCVFPCFFGAVTTPIFPKPGAMAPGFAVTRGETELDGFPSVCAGGDWPEIASIEYGAPSA